MNRIKRILDFDQSIWLDFLDRKVMDSGQLQQLIEKDGIRGLTSNPAIFEKAIGGSSDYDDDIVRFAREKEDNEDIFFEIAIKDIQRAADIFESVYNGTAGRDGFVSLEVSPGLARDTQGTIEQAKELWRRVNRKNLMVKIPGTQEGLGAIRECIGAGINVNVTLLFGLPRYVEVAEAYIQGLEDRLEAGGSVDGIASVASFFLSRIDAEVDPMLREMGLDDMVGKVAIASAKGAYSLYGEIFKSPRFRELERQGAKTQRLLWASTSTKDPSFPDLKYMEALIGEDTVNTVPTETLEAFRDHGNAADNLRDNMDGAQDTLKRLEDHDIDIDAITRDLTDQGIGKFSKPFGELLKRIGEQKEKLASGQ